MIQSEAQLEAEFLAQLHGLGWSPATLPDADALLANLQIQLEAFNGLSLSSSEFARLRGHLEAGTAFDAWTRLREPCTLPRDDGTAVTIRFLDMNRLDRNRLQVTSQLTMKDKRTNRYDVTLLVNGLPLVQVELKRRGVEIAEAFNQLNRYDRDSFGALGGLFRYLQLQVISNGVNTRYLAHNLLQLPEMAFTWSGPDNRAINMLDEFTQAFLAPGHLLHMVTHCMVRHVGLRSLMVLRPYQFHAVEAILRHLREGTGHGHVWHATGSGKTLTSFKAAQRLAALPEIDKVVFVVDRADLDYQTQKEFNEFERGSVDATEDTRQLVSHLADPGRRLLVTTIQKLNLAVTRRKFLRRLDPMRKGRIVFIFDECHRSQFGTAHGAISEFFPQARFIGFTGTPILAPNAIGGRTTQDLFGACLHRYLITDAIADGSVLPFAIEYVRDDPPVLEPTGNTRRDRKRQRDLERVRMSAEFFDHPDRIGAVADWVIANHDRKTARRKFGAIMAVGSVDSLLAYQDAFAARDHDLKIATIFTCAANEEDPAATGIIPEDDVSGETLDLPRRDRLQGFVDAYNARYGTNESVMDGQGFRAYHQAISRRMKLRDRAPEKPEKFIDILLVVNMFLTGFDARGVNTLYVDKNLRWHGLIQAFSRTNRTRGLDKAHGNVVSFRDLKENTDEAVALFANRDAPARVIAPSYEARLEEFAAAAQRLRKVAPTPAKVDDLRDENRVREFVEAFRALLRIRSAMAMFARFDPDDLAIPPQEFEDYKSKYLDLDRRARQGEDPALAEFLSGMDFELELVRRDEINVAYILALLGQGKRERAEALLAGEPSLQGRQPLLRRFIDKVMPGLPAGADMEITFEAFQQDAEAEDIRALAEREHLREDAARGMLERLARSGKQPLPDEIAASLSRPMGLRERSAAGARIQEALAAMAQLYRGPAAAQQR